MPNIITIDFETLNSNNTVPINNTFYGCDH